MNCFDDVVLGVTQLPSGLWGRLAFAATCAERLLPFYICYTKRQGSGAENYFVALDYVWNCLGVANCDPHDVAHLLVECERTLPDEDSAWNAGCPYADDATAAILYCLRLISSGDQQEAIWAAKRAYEVADNFVVAHTDHSIDSHEDELEVLHHPVIQNELGRQLRDLRELQRVGTDLPTLQGLCKELRQRAQSDAVAFFGSSSNPSSVPPN